MSTPEIVLNAGADGAGDDVDMEGEEETVEVIADDNGEEDKSGLENIEPVIAVQPTFLAYLKSPIVELVVGSGDAQTTLSVHQELLVQSPFFKEAVAQFSDGAARRRIELLDEDLAATSSFLEYLYRRDYFPTLTGPRTLEHDSSMAPDDDSGVALLRHARIYTLAQRFRLPALATLSHSKIHIEKSTAKGEIAYARYVYANTGKEDIQIRKPVAFFWANRSYVLRHEAESEFKTMCLDFPQFGFDVLSLVLDAQEKRSQRQDASAQGSARKRVRVSQG